MNNRSPSNDQKTSAEYELEIGQLKAKLATAEAKIAELEHQLSLYEDRAKAMFDADLAKQQREHDHKLAELELERLKHQRLAAEEIARRKRK